MIAGSIFSWSIIHDQEICYSGGFNACTALWTADTQINLNANNWILKTKKLVPTYKSATVFFLYRQHYIQLQSEWFHESQTTAWIFAIVYRALFFITSKQKPLWKHFFYSNAPFCNIRFDICQSTTLTESTNKVNLTVVISRNFIVVLLLFTRFLYG